MGVFSDLKPTNHAPRNGFDCSRRSVFSTKNGMILPVFVQPTLPTSDYRIDVQQLLRTQPLQTAAFTGFSINYDFAFVPYNQLYSSFNQFIGQREDAFLAKQPSFQTIPLFPLLFFISNYRESILYDFIVSDLSGDYDIALKSQVGAAKPFAAPYRILMSNFGDNSVWIDIIRAFDMYGYFNLLPFFKRAKEIWHSNLTTDITSWIQFFNHYRFDEGADLLSELGNAFTIALSGDDVSLNFSPDALSTEYNIFAPLSYNKIFYEFYRNKYYDTNVQLVFANIEEDYPNFPKKTFVFNYNELFNFDDYVPNTSGDYDERLIFRIFAIFALHYHAYRRDLFTGVLPSMQFGNVSMQIANAVEDGLQTKYILEAGLADRTSVRDAVRVDNNGHLMVPAISSSTDERVNFGFAPELAISVLESRRADAMQRFRERMLRAGDSTRDIFKAHGWESPRSEQFHDPIFLGSFDGRLDINTVAATTAAGLTQELGQLAGNGVGVVSGSEIKFHSADFGVIIGVMYIVKDSEYNSFGTDRQYCLTEPFDFPYPELQNISLSPVVYRQLQGLYLSNRYANRQPYQYGYSYKRPNDILGYLPAFMEYKTAVDKVHGEFCAGEYLLATQAFGAGLYYGRSLNFSGVFSDWVTPRRDILQPDSLKFLYQQPSIVDNVFLQAQTDNQDTDPFLVNAYFKCLAVQPLSVIGLPV